ncbi:hypothetical protein ACFRFQ_17990 [Rhodococcus sp. NPDC056743]|uniref:hypothetical protein n=1 Tax=Rhodococcus sp. NPDC056743 TaxID=3345934 RepID=UPI00366E099E
MTFSAVDVDHHQFFLCASGADPSAVSSRGDVFDSGPNLVVVHTGIASGRARVALSILKEPSVGKSDSWDNVNQATLAVTQPLVILTTLGDVTVDLGAVDPPGTGYLTVRVSVRGRAENWDLDVEDSSEEYLIETWPGRGPAVHEIVKSTDSTWADHIDKSPSPKVDASDRRISDATVRLRGPVRWDPEMMSNK